MLCSRKRKKGVTMSRVVHFEIPVDDPERGVKFYQRVFDWKIDKWDGPEDYWLVTTGEKNEPGIDGAIMRRMPGATTINTIDVPSVDEFTKKVTEAGGKIVMPKTPVPGIGYFVYCADTEGNVFGMMQNDPSAH
jgi:predicted enzyme related to lactoylglutathione lyase